jgi:hypothetical protein
VQLCVRYRLAWRYCGKISFRSHEGTLNVRQCARKCSIYSTQRMLVNRQTCGAKWVVCRLAHPAIQCKGALVQSKHVWFCKCSASVLGPALLPRCPETPHLQTSISCQRIGTAFPAAMGAILAVTVAGDRRPTHVRCTPVQSLRQELSHGDAVNSHRRTKPPA